MTTDRTPYLPTPGALTVISAEWCGHCTTLKSMLKHAGIAYSEVMVEEVPDAEAIANEANSGSWLIPTVLFSDGSAAVNPSLDEVAKRLAEVAAA